MYRIADMRNAHQRHLPRRGLASLVVLVLLALTLPATAVPADAAAPGQDGWQARQVRKGGLPSRDRDLAKQLPGRAKVGYHPETGRVRLISGSPSVPLSERLPGVAAGKRELTGTDARGRARRFVDRYGPLFGLKAPARELRVRATQRTTGRGIAPANVGGAGLPNATVRFEQVRDGVPVLGGEIVVQVSAVGEVLSASGEVLPSTAKAATGASISVARARDVAATWLAREAGRSRAGVLTSSEGLGLYDPRVMDDPNLADVGTRLVWRIDARLPVIGSKLAQRRLVLVDARAGQVLTSINRIKSAEGPNRRICDNRNVPGKPWGCSEPLARSEGQPATGVTDVDTVYRLMGVTYDYFADRFGRDGIDGKGSRMKATVRYCPSSGCPWRNAEWRWKPQQATFGRGWARADDIVAHEYTHGILDAEAPLFYQYQSGAINESYADVFGELVDLSHPGGKDTKWATWKIGEDTPVGVFRDMRDPTRYGHPDRVRSGKWFSGSGDDGGVHKNSGVGNKAAYLMAAGGTFRGYKISGIGRERTARVWYQALTARLTPAANYIDLADALVAACTDLAGSDGMTLAHCDRVRDATRATQMNLKPKVLAPKTAPICAGGSSPTYLLRDDLEDPDSGAWVAGRTVGSKRGWYWPQNPNNVPGWDGTWASNGKLNFYAPNRSSRSDATMRLQVPVDLPKGAFLRFGHGYSFDKDAKRRYDGGVVEIKVDGGPWRGVGGLFTHGGYNGSIAKARGNPLAGRRAWTGNSHGWSKARVDLSDFAGSMVKVRFRVGTDKSIGGRGWYIDDVRIYTCAKDSDAPTGSLSIDGGAGSTSDPSVSLAFDYADATTWVAKLRVSGSPALSSGGVQLAKGITMPIRSTLPWDLADTTFGGSGTTGTRRVYAQVRDAAGNWSEVFSDEIELLEA